MECIEKILDTVNSFVWGPPMLILLFGTHLFLTFKLKFIQRYIKQAIKLSFQSSQEGDGDISHFGALTTALAATIGTGNIVGVATAISAGGPGAVFWMWLTGVFGIATKYAEAVLSIKYRITTPDGSKAGGPMYVLDRGMNCKWLAILSAIFTAIAAFGIGNMVQANAISTMLKETINISPVLSGSIMTFLVALVILGGIKSIANVCKKLVPIMVILYTVGCIILLAINIKMVPAAILTIIKTAFTGQAMIGGFLGAGIKEAVRYGIARGLFSNESGLGSAPIVASAAQTKNPVRQALVSSTGTFWDTVVVCAMTGVMLVSSGEWTKGLKGIELTKSAFSNFPYFGSIILTTGLLTFVFSTLIGWSYYGEKAVEYLLTTKAIKPYRWLWVAAVMLGANLNLTAVWAFSDIANALMAIPNLISLIFLHKVIVKETENYLWSGKLDDKSL